MGWYKFYVVKFTNKKYKTPHGKVFFKFGITHYMKVEHRFDPNIVDGYEKNYEDWDIKVMFSIVCKSLAEAQALESHWLETVYPKSGPNKVWVEKVLGLGDQNYYYNNSGITELRLLDIDESRAVLNGLFNMKPKEQKLA